MKSGIWRHNQVRLVRFLVTIPGYGTCDLSSESDLPFTHKLTA